MARPSSEAVVKGLPATRVRLEALGPQAVEARLEAATLATLIPQEAVLAAPATSAPARPLVAQVEVQCQLLLATAIVGRLLDSLLLSYCCRKREVRYLLPERLH